MEKSYRWFLVIFVPGIIVCCLTYAVVLFFTGSALLTSFLAIVSGLSLAYALFHFRLLSPLRRFTSSAKNTARSPELSRFAAKVKELEPLARIISSQEEVLKQAVLEISELNKPDVERTKLEPVKHQALANALSEVRKEMEEIARKEREGNWVTQGLARFVDILRSNNQDISKLGDRIISELVRYLDANQGGLFILSQDDEQEKAYLELIACYAYERKKYLQKRVEIGEGLLGQVYLEKEYIYLTDVPQNYVHITSGLGQSTPESLLLVPLVINEEVFGVLELASFREFKAYQIEFLNKLGESIASTISNVRAGEHNRRLLEESQLQAEQMRAQEEEMRQNMEELQATQEEMQRAQKAMQQKEKENERMLEELENIKVQLQSELEAKVGEIQSEKARADIFLNTTHDAILYLDESLNITFINKGGEKMFSYQPDQLYGKSLETIIQSDCKDKSLLEDYLSNAKQLGNTCEYVGKSNMYGFTFPISMAITEGTVNDQKVYTAIIRNIQKQKEQESRMQKTVNSAKEVHDRLMDREKQFKEVEQELARIKQQLQEKEATIAQLEAKNS